MRLVARYSASGDTWHHLQRSRSTCHL